MIDVDSLWFAWVHRTMPGVALVTSMIVGTLFHFLARDADTRRDATERPWFDLYCGIGLAAWVFAGVMCVVWKVPAVTVTPLSPAGYTMASGTVGCFEAFLVGLLWFGMQRWRSKLGVHRWDDKRRVQC